MIINGAEITVIVQLLLAAALGSVIGWERERAEKPAGLRTIMLVTLGSTLFTAISRFGFTGIVEIGLDPSRVASSIVTGIGFLGAGVILYQSQTHRVQGLTTAAGLWFAAAIGMAVGVEFYLVAVVATVAGFAILRLLSRVEPRSQLHNGSQSFNHADAARQVSGEGGGSTPILR